MSVDHTPDLPEETEYIIKNGGTIVDNRVNGSLAVSRCLGDGKFGDCINPTPHFIQENLSPVDQFLIIATDGIFDKIDDQKACDIVLGEIDPLEAAKKLRDSAFELDSQDNISVIVVYLY